MMSINKVQVHSESSHKKRVLNIKEYNKICDYIESFKGLPIDCSVDIVQHFSDIDPLALKSILEIHISQQNRKQYVHVDGNGLIYLQRYKSLCKNNNNSDILLQVAKEYRISPIMLCRNILKLELQLEGRRELTHLLRYPHLIKDPQLSANVMQCICSDNQDGMLTDLRRRVLGEEYELKLKQMAIAAGLHYNDENELRRLGYDKTPDLKMILPFLYKDNVINWLESKAIFGDIKTHNFYTKQQYQSYCNRFGAGIVIYWCGYLEEAANHIESTKIGIFVLDNFPERKDIQLLDLSITNAHVANNSP